MLSSIDFRNFIIYLFLFGTTVFINKFVLSVLCFTYPTIYQGWQTLIGGVLLKILLSKTSCIENSPTSLDKGGFISLLPSFLFFVAGIVASSKALANLSVGMFLCLHNTLCSLLYVLEIFPSIKNRTSDSSYNSGAPKTALSVIAALVSLASATVAVIGDLNMTFSDSPYFWLLVSLGCVAVQKLHSRIADARYTEVDRIYFSYIFSVVLLAPASLYLEEAFEVLRFPYSGRVNFIGACLVVGVVALLLSLHTIKIQQTPNFSKMDALSKLICSLVSLLIFTDDTTPLVKFLVVLNLSAGILVPASTISAPADTAPLLPSVERETPPESEKLMSPQEES